MNYRHDYHAGNFADVVKHVVLVRILLHLIGKPAPFRYIETHAGSGTYHLGGLEAETTGEWRRGIGRLLAADFPPPVHDLLAPYLAIVGPSVESADPHYEGSPAIAAALLRRHDKMLFCELHPFARESLETRLGRDRRTKIIGIDGYVGLKAYIPPVERRGLVLIDPPFESPNEFSRLAESLAGALRKWQTGIFMLWYPVKDASVVEAFMKAFLRGLSATSRGDENDRVLRLELQIDDPRSEGSLARTGLLVVNPPFRLEGEARLVFPYLAECLASGRAGFRVDRARSD
jgi:23S rRNA (adenine2030-N6)-methyltransferase